MHALAHDPCRVSTAFPPSPDVSHGAPEDVIPRIRLEELQ